MSTVQEQLIKHLDEAHAMEQSVLRMLDGMISTTDDPRSSRSSSTTRSRPKDTRSG